MILKVALIIILLHDNDDKIVHVENKDENLIIFIVVTIQTNVLYVK